MSFVLLPLTRGKSVLIDEEDLPLISQYRWNAARRHRNWYAVGNGSDQKSVYMHRLLLGAITGQVVDHRNSNGLDNRRINLRLCSSQQNGQNGRRHSDSTVPYKGIRKNPNSQQWSGIITVNYRQISLGTYPTMEEAALAYNDAAIHYFGEFARLNNVSVDRSTWRTERDLLSADPARSVFDMALYGEGL